jgi:hypothetical protein
VVIHGLYGQNLVSLGSLKLANSREKMKSRPSHDPDKQTNKLSANVTTKQGAKKNETAQQHQDCGKNHVSHAFGLLGRLQTVESYMTALAILPAAEKAVPGS